MWEAQEMVSLWLQGSTPASVIGALRSGSLQGDGGIHSSLGSVSWCHGMTGMAGDVEGDLGGEGHPLGSILYSSAPFITGHLVPDPPAPGSRGT